MMFLLLFQGNKRKTTLSKLTFYNNQTKRLPVALLRMPQKFWDKEYEIHFLLFKLYIDEGYPNELGYLWSCKESAYTKSVYTLCGVK